jgi:4-hydroxy-3-methylbut-2-enyl diphosphate reductase
MNRSVVREFQALGVTVRRGEVLVPTEVGDPARGGLGCQAAKLVGGSLQRRGNQPSYGPVPRFDNPGYDSDGATLYLVTTPQGDGGTAALAAAAAPDDHLAMAAAQAAVAEWAAALGTRRLLAAGSPWCGGANQALAAARTAVADAGSQGRGVYIYGQLAAPPEEHAALAASGVRFGSALDDVQPGDILVFAAHGVPPAVRAEATSRELTIVDATCPLVARAQAEAGRLADQGDHLILLGQPDLPTTAAITGHAPGKATVIGTVAAASALRPADPRRVSYLLQPGVPVEGSAGAAAALRSRFPAVRAPDPDGFCYAPSDRVDMVRAVATGADLMLILGDPDAADARQLAALARECKARTLTVAAVSEIIPSLVGGADTIGMAESTSAPAGLAAEVTTALGGLGPLSVVRREVRSHVARRSATVAVTPG